MEILKGLIGDAVTIGFWIVGIWFVWKLLGETGSNSGSAGDGYPGWWNRL